MRTAEADLGVQSTLGIISWERAPSSTGIELDCVASSILGASGRATLDALIGGTTRSLSGPILAHLDFLDEQIARLSGAIEVELARAAQEAHAETQQPRDGLRDELARQLVGHHGGEGVRAGPSAPKSSGTGMPAALAEAVDFDGIRRADDDPPAPASD